MDRVNRYGVRALLVLGTLCAFIAVFALWANRQLLNTDNWTTTSSRLLQNPEVRAAVSGFLVEQLFTNVDVAGQLESALPDEVKPLAGPATGALRGPATDLAKEALAAPQVQGFWADANRAAHRQFLALVQNRSRTISVEGDAVTLNLGTLVGQIGTRIGLPANLISRIPPGVGRLAVLRSDQVGLVRAVGQGLSSAATLIIVLVLALFGLAIALAGGRRRATLRSAGVGLISAGAGVLIVRSVAGPSVVDTLSQTAAVEPAAAELWRISTSMLVLSAQSLIVNGLLIVLCAWLAGPTRSAVSLRRALAPYAARRRAVAYAVVAALFALLALWGPTYAFRSLFGLLTVAVLLAIGTFVLLRQMTREFPDPEPVDLASAAAAAWTRVRGALGPGIRSSAEGDVLAQLERLAALRREGVLTDAELAVQKATILDRD